MKQIMQGVIYDTETATFLAKDLTQNNCFKEVVA